MSKYEKFSREELMALVEKQDGELASKKYGLVWDSEREPEQVVLDCEHNLPVLKRVKGKEIREPKGNGLEDNILIEGDNYHALTVLNYTHPESVDVIYIDPPYNTGNKDFKYNDKFVDREDGFRHSKWLNFMEKRLNLAKDLLKKTGVIFISIDDNEQAQLKMLCDKVFGEDNFRNFIVVSRVKKNIQEKEYARSLNLGHGLVLFYAMAQSEIIIPTKFQQKEERWHAFDAPGIRKTMEYEIFGHKPPKGRHWMLEEKKVVELIAKGLLRPSPKTGRPQYRLEASDVTRLDTNWSDLQEGGSKWNFENGEKNIVLMKRIIGMHPSKGSVILDFFAGSGTTGQAVLELNKEDGGNRKFILCTNNENKICEEVTYPRLQKVIKGYKKNGDGEKVEGLGGNLQYFKTDLLKQTKNKDQVRIDLTYKCTEMLCVKENIFNLEVDEEDYKVFSSNSGDRFLCVYYNLFDESFADFLKEIKKLKGEKKVYMFSADGRVDSKLFAGVKDCEVEEIPQKIVEVYRRLVKMNIPVKADTIFLDFEKAQKKVFEESEKDEGARILRIVLEKTIQKIAQKNNMSIFKENHREEKIDVLNSLLKDARVFNKVQWEENKTYLAIGNHAAHGDYGEYVLKQVENFYRHVQSLFNDFGI